MSQIAASVEEFFTAHQESMISCPYQPGNLKISRQACLKRQKEAQRRRLEVSKVEDLFHYFLSQGLLRCQKCNLVQTSGR